MKTTPFATKAAPCLVLQWLWQPTTQPSMVQHSEEISLEGQLANPGSLNQWLRANQGYQCLAGDCCNLVLDAPDRIPGQVPNCSTLPLNL
jgi:hypothetical protein